MAEIIIQNNNCTINNEHDHNFIQSLDEELSFRFKGVEYTQAFKNKRWDGFTRLLSRQLSFPYGLLSRVKNFYKKHGKSLSIIDERHKTKKSSISIIKNLQNIDKNPYSYQLRALDSVKESDCGILALATGSGKTILSTLMTAHFNKRTIIYVIGVDLLYQLYDLYQQVFDQEIGIIGDGKCEIRDINIATVWTVGCALGIKSKNILVDNLDKESLVEVSKYAEIQALMKEAKVHIFDECHLAACDTVQEIGKRISPEYIYGMSASPFRDDGKDMLIEAILGPQICHISASYLIKRDYLAKPYINFYKVPRFGEKLPKNFHTISKKYILENDIRNKMIVNGVDELIGLNYQPLVLYDKIKHGKVLFDSLSKNIPCTLLSGDDSTDVRKQAKEDIETGKIKCIIASKIFDIGVDLPSLSGLIIANGGKSSVRAYQRIGRVIRKYKNKKKAAVIEFFDQAHYLRQHSKTRYNLYCREEEFVVSWPK